MGNKIEITEAEERFCQLYLFGELGFAGRRVKCYKEVFGDTEKNIPYASFKLLNKTSIKVYIKKVMDEEQQEIETIAVKLQVAETLKAVMDETSTATYADKFGVDLSPAPLRAVSVNAAKALMDIYPVKNADNTKKNENSGGNITFNVIVPEVIKQKRADEED